MEKEKTPKKRGRKPGSKNKVKKDKSVLEKAPEKKKRGRKPKTNITINENPIFTSDENKNKNLIIKINNTSIDSLDNMNKLDCNFHFNNNISNEINNNEKYTNGKLCWNCCHTFMNIVEGLPIKYVDNIFYTYGNFCSLECATRYCFDNLNNDAPEIYSIINLYNIIVNNKKTEIKCAPHKLTLDIFGGPLTIEQYRNSFNTIDYYNVTIPPLVQLNTQISLPEKNKYYNKEHLKIYRKKEINNENNIINMMNNS
tara:strand:- start:868 stop:1632 length:765 start_codon:yes stop_codon:yes gene_type:complete